MDIYKPSESAAGRRQNILIVRVPMRTLTSKSFMLNALLEVPVEFLVAPIVDPNISRPF